MTLFELYQHLMSDYGPQGWWPLVTHSGCNPTKTGAIHGYHPGDYSFPRNELEQFEICIGAILTQNTAWLNAEKALIALQREDRLRAEVLVDCEQEEIAALIQPSGYYNSKTKKILSFTTFYLGLQERNPSRQELLKVWGIGPETADCMLLYAYKQPEMVVDAYTRRILAHHGFVDPNVSYEKLKHFCETHLPRDLIVYQEFHALIVEHAKRCYRRPWQDSFLWL